MFIGTNSPGKSVAIIPDSDFEICFSNSSRMLFSRLPSTTVLALYIPLIFKLDFNALGTVLRISPSAETLSESSLMSGVPKSLPPPITVFFPRRHLR